MMQLLAKRRGVTVAALLTTIACVTVAVGMVYFFFQGQDLWAAMKLAPVISVLTAFPFSYFIWWQLRRNILLNLKLERMVNRDRLTDVATRDFFFSRMNGEPEAYGISLMVDIDHFKTVNDTYGHLAGDAVISRVAHILNQNTRSNDIVCRFGGEEFIVFLREYGKSSGYEAAERMREMIADDVVPFEGHQLRVTVSIGGSLKERLEGVELAIRQADEALYRAKSGGRNRTVFASRSRAAAKTAIA